MGYEYEKNQDEMRKQQALKRRKEIQRRRIRRRRIKQRIVLVSLVGLFLIICIATGNLIWGREDQLASVAGVKNHGLFSMEPSIEPVMKPEIIEEFLTINEYSRPGDALEEVNNIFVHYVGNPNTTAKQNRDHFEDLATTAERSASSHFVIGLDGEIIQCVPLDEIAYAVKTRNYDSISIECCHPAEDGKFTDATYQSLIELLYWLLEYFDLEKDDILRHYDSNGKLCPLYYAENEDEWEQLKNDVMSLAGE